LFEQFGEALFGSASGGCAYSRKPEFDTLEERQLLSGFTVGNIVQTVSPVSLVGAPQQPSNLSGFTVGNIAHTSPPISLTGLPQQYSNMSSVTDASGRTVFFEITADQSVWYWTPSYQSNGWHNTGEKALSVSAGTDGVGNAAAFVIGTDHAVHEYLVATESWISLGGYALSISATQSPGFPNIVYAIGSDSKLYATSGFGGWTALGSPVGTSTNGELETISSIDYVGANGYPLSVCYATDSNGKVWQWTSLPMNGGGFGGVPGGTWSSTGGANAIQIAAGYDYNANPVVYALSWDHRVWVYDGGSWSSVGGTSTYALEISAGRSWAANNPSRNVVYAIGGNHSVYVFNNSANATWRSSVGWQDLGGYATAITAEAVHYTDYIDGVFANDAYNNVYEYLPGLSTSSGSYSYWAPLYGPQVHQSTTPLFS
jgi:hypothetical protein